jgi:hypothetical protein
VGVVVGSATSLLQAYGVSTEYFSLNRVPAARSAIETSLPSRRHRHARWWCSPRSPRSGASTASWVASACDLSATLVLSRSRARRARHHRVRRFQSAPSRISRVSVGQKRKRSGGS